MGVWPPRRKEWLSWVFVCAWSLLIFATIPLARALRDVVSEHLGREAFTYIVLVCIGLGALLGLRAALRRGLPPISNLIWLLGVTMAFVAYTLELGRNPEEALHLIEYGVLGFLLCQAFSHRTRSVMAYGMAAVVVGIVGMFDEGVQWLTPGRHWGLSDIIVNFVAGVLVQIGIAMGFRPPALQAWPDAGSVARFFRLTAFGLVLLGLCFLNSPQRIVWYAERIPPLAYLIGTDSTMVEYGYLYRDDKIGSFKSRLTPEQLAEADRARGQEAAAILNNYQSRELYKDFLARFPSLVEPFIHEAGVHFFRRDSYLDLAREAEDVDDQERTEFFTIAYRENQILETYFPNTLAHSQRTWTPETRELVQRESSQTPDYDSRVSRTVVTSPSPWAVFAIFTVLIGGCLALAFGFARQARRTTSKEGLSTTGPQ